MDLGESNDGSDRKDDGRGEQNGKQPDDNSGSGPPKDDSDSDKHTPDEAQKASTSQPRASEKKKGKMPISSGDCRPGSLDAILGMTRSKASKARPSEDVEEEEDINSTEGLEPALAAAINEAQYNMARNQELPDPRPDGPSSSRRGSSSRRRSLQLKLTKMIIPSKLRDTLSNATPLNINSPQGDSSVKFKPETRYKCIARREDPDDIPPSTPTPERTGSLLPPGSGNPKKADSEKHKQMKVTRRKKQEYAQDFERRRSKSIASRGGNKHFQNAAFVDEADCPSLAYKNSSADETRSHSPSDALLDESECPILTRQESSAERSGNPSPSASLTRSERRSSSQADSPPLADHSNSVQPTSIANLAPSTESRQAAQDQSTHGENTSSPTQAGQAAQRSSTNRENEAPLAQAGHTTGIRENQADTPDDSKNPAKSQEADHHPGSDNSYMVLRRIIYDQDPAVAIRSLFSILDFTTSLSPAPKNCELFSPANAGEDGQSDVRSTPSAPLEHVPSSSFWASPNLFSKACGILGELLDEFGDELMPAPDDTTSSSKLSSSGNELRKTHINNIASQIIQDERQIYSQTLSTRRHATESPPASPQLQAPSSSPRKRRMRKPNLRCRTDQVSANASPMTKVPQLDNSDLPSPALWDRTLLHVNPDYSSPEITASGASPQEVASLNMVLNESGARASSDDFPEDGLTSVDKGHALVGGGSTTSLHDVGLPTYLGIHDNHRPLYTMEEAYNQACLMQSTFKDAAETIPNTGAMDKEHSLLVNMLRCFDEGGNMGFFIYLVQSDAWKRSLSEIICRKIRLSLTKMILTPLQEKGHGACDPDQALASGYQPLRSYDGFEYRPEEGEINESPESDSPSFSDKAAPTGEQILPPPYQSIFSSTLIPTVPENQALELSDCPSTGLDSFSKGAFAAGSQLRQTQKRSNSSSTVSSGLSVITTISYGTKASATSKLSGGPDSVFNSVVSSPQSSGLNDTSQEWKPQVAKSAAKTGVAKEFQGSCAESLRNALKMSPTTQPVQTSGDKFSRFRIRSPKKKPVEQLFDALRGDQSPMSGAVPSGVGSPMSEQATRPPSPGGIDLSRLPTMNKDDDTESAHVVELQVEESAGDADADTLASSPLEDGHQDSGV